jgi:WD40 repeat protein
LSTGELHTFAPQIPLADLDYGGPLLSQDGRFMAFIIQEKPDEIAVLSLQSEELRIFTAPKGQSRGIRFSKDGRYLACAGGPEAQGEIAVWEVESGLRHAIKGHEQGTTAIAFDGERLISAGNLDGIIKIWNIESGQLLDTWSGNPGYVTKIETSKEGDIITVNQDSTMEVWLHNGERLHLRGHGAPPSHFGFLSGKLITASSDETIRVWRLENKTGQVLPRSQSEPSRSFSRDDFLFRGDDLKFSSDGRFVAYLAGDTGFKEIILWELSSQQTKVLIGHSDMINSLDFSPDGKWIASAAQDQSVRIWSVESGALEHILSGSTGSVYRVVFSPDGKTLAAAGEDATIYLWDVASGALLRTLSGHTKPIRCLRFSPNGAFLASSSSDSVLRLWSTKTWEGRALEGAGKLPYSLQFSSDTELLAATDNSGYVVFWDTASGKFLQKIRQGYGGHRLGMAFSPDAKMIASGAWYGPMKLYQRDAEGVFVFSRALKGHRTDVTGIAFSVDGSMLASVSFDQSVGLRLWDVQSGEGRTLSNGKIGHPASVASVVFSPDGASLASIDLAGFVFLWRDDLPKDPAALRAYLSDPVRH